MKATTAGTALVWFRQDLRLADNPALVAACATGLPIVPVFIDDPLDGTAARIGAASRVWLHHSLCSLDASLRACGSALICRQGDALGVLEELRDECNATRIFWNRCHDPDSIARDAIIKRTLDTLQPKTFNGLLMFEPWTVLKKDRTPYKVYTPYWRAAAALYDAARSDSHDSVLPSKAPDAVPTDKASRTLRGAGDIDSLGLLPERPTERPWHKDLIAHWQVGEEAAMARLESFLSDAVEDYDEARDLPARPGTSRLSPHLHHGEISPRQILARLSDGRLLTRLGDGETTFAKEVFWREFAYSLIHHFPDTVSEPLDRRFKAFPWEADAAVLAAWQQGRTGVPIVDAGMRQLYATGWMHNRVRMIVASYLVKNLLQPWQQGEAWFRDCLVDADLASNTMGWQWTAGCGADAAPFFRVFNPVLQGEKFDQAGKYVRQWVPELAALGTRHIHKPWELPDAERESLDYPAPMVDLKLSRQRALDAFATIRA